MFNIIITGITSLLTDMSTEMVYPLIPLYLSALGAPPAILGVIEGFAESSASLLKVFSGSLSDRLRRRKPVAIAGYAGSLFGKLLLYLSHSWGLVFAGRMVDRIGKGVRVAPRDALIADCAPTRTRGRAFGLHRALDTLGAVLGVLAALYLTTRLGNNLNRSGYQRLFLFSLFPAALGVIILFFVQETQKKPATSPSPRITGRGLPAKLRLFFIVITIFALGNSSNTFLLLKMKTLGWGTLGILSLYLLYNLTYALLSYPAGRLSDRIGRKHLLILGYALYAVVYLGFALLHPKTARTLPFILFAIYGVYSALTEGLEKALVADLAPEENRGTFIGLHATLTGLGLLPASLLAGTLWNLFGPRVPFLLGGALGLAAALGLALMI